MMKNTLLKNKKGFTIAQVLAYAIISVMVFASFFAVTAASRTGNTNLMNKSDVMYQVYNLEKMQKEIKYATKIVKVCDDETGENCTNGNRYIEITDKTGEYNKLYGFKDASITLTELKNDGTGVTATPQYENVEDVSFTKHYMEAGNKSPYIKVVVTLRKNQATYKHTYEIFPNAWLNGDGDN